VIIDSHHHLWDPALARYPFLDQVPALRRRFAPDDFASEIEAHAIRASIVVQARSSLEETEQLVAIAEATPWIAGAVGWVDLTSGEEVGPAVKGLRERGLVGVRHQVHDEADAGWLMRPDVQRGLDALSSAGLAFDLLVRTRELPAAVACARRHPELTMVLDHVGKPPFGKAAMADWREAFQRLATRPNVFCKLSGLLTETDDGEAASQVVREALTHFGADRCLWGSDWPVCLLAGSYADTLELVRSALDDKTTPLVLAETAVHAYRLELR
jgi:L-fuconolactonase